MMAAVTRCLLFAAALSLAASTTRAQPFQFKSVWIPPKQDAAQREADSYAGLVFNFETAKKTGGGTPNGNLKSDDVTQNPFLATLPGDGNSQLLVTLGPCAGNPVHSHPRGSEISFVTSGEMLFGIIEENTAAGANVPILRNIQVGQTIHVPQGLMHFSHNPTCFPAQFLANFATSDPGTQTTYNSLLGVPDAVLHMSTGIPEAMWRQLRAQYPLVIAPGTGGEECLARCGLTFNETNAFFPPAVLPVPGAYGAPPLGAYASVSPGYGIELLPGGKYSTPRGPTPQLPTYGRAPAPAPGVYPTPRGPGTPGRFPVVSPLPAVNTPPPPTLAPVPSTPPPTPLTPLSAPRPTAAPTATAAAAAATTPSAPTSSATAAATPAGGPSTSTSATGNAAAQASNSNGSFSSSTGAPSAATGFLQNPFDLLG